MATQTAGPPAKTPDVATPTNPTGTPLNSLPKAMILDWQRYLNAKGANPQITEDGKPGKGLYAAFKILYPLATETNGVPNLTLAELRPALRDPEWPRLWISPTGGDLMHCRPYFMVPLLETSFVGEHQILWEDIGSYVNAVKEETKAAGPAITDVFVMSHGWHRNYFSGVAAYDRLLSRMSVLRSRGRLTMKGDQSEEERPFRPLFLGLHWNSDPTSDDWVDTSGRRDKTNFLDNASHLFTLKNGKANDAKFITDFENFFAYMSSVSAPDRDPLQGDSGSQSAWLKTVLDADYEVRGMVKPATVEEKVSTLWRCYDESETKALLTGQDLPAKSDGNIVDALRAIVGFLVGVGVIGLPLLPKIISWLGGSAAAQKFSDQVNLKVLAPAGELLALLRLPVNETSEAVMAGIWVSLLCGTFLGLLALGAHEQRRKSSARGFPLLEAVLWLPFQILCTLPLLVFLFATWLFKTWLVLLAILVWLYSAYLPNKGPLNPTVLAVFIVVACALYSFTPLSDKVVFRERLKSPGDHARNARYPLAALARFPIFLLRNAVSGDSLLSTLATTIDKQFAFFEYQRKGVNAGRDAGRFLNKLYAACPDLKDAKLHFFGHSFGGLVVANAARTMLDVYPDEGKSQGKSKHAHAARSLRKEFDEQKFLSNSECDSLFITSLTLIQAAMGSAWYRGEDKLVSRVTGAVACIFSRYDTANSFWYPLTNNGRMAAGSVGLCDVPRPASSPDGLVRMGQNGEFTLVVEPPAEIEARRPQAQLNLDCSRIIYEGAVATGGGHDDIFKDDVVNIVWAITQIG